MNRSIGSKIILLCFFCFSFSAANSAHIVGGDVTYTFTGFNADTTVANYRVNFTIYRDALGGGADFDPPNLAFFGIFEEVSPNNWQLVREFNGIDHTTPVRITPNDDPCVIEPLGSVSVEEASYIFPISLPIIDRNYMISYQRCCRNETVSNLIAPGDTGAAFDVIITPQAQREGNSSPTFDEFPPIFICAGFPISVDQSASDADGDLLQYTFCHPFTAGGTLDANAPAGGMGGCCDCVRPMPGICEPPFDNVTFFPPFSMSQPLGGDPVVSIDPNTGIITGTPNATGQFVVGVCVEEFRNGVSIGKIRRDFQFNVLTCNRQVDASVASTDVEQGVDGETTFVIMSCGDTTLTVRNTSTDVNFIRTIDWEFFDDGNLFFSQSGGTDMADADVTFPGLGVYTGMLVANLGLECSDTAFFRVDLFPAIEGDYVFDFDTCVAGPVMFTDQSSTGGDMLVGWDWEFEPGSNSSVQNPMFEYDTPGSMEVTLIVEDNNECMDTTTQIVDYFPAPETIVVEPSNFIGCVPATILFENLSFPIDSTYDILWDFGDGGTDTLVSPTYTYLEPGDFAVSLSIVSPIGCAVERDFGELISIQESPDAAFDCEPDQLTNFNRTASFTDLTDIAGAWSWDFGGVGSSFLQNPTFTFPDTGVFRVRLTAFHPITNCPDTASKLIDVIPVVEFHFPNAFTPNGDASNDLFLGNGFADGLRDFELTIWNRWGQLIFQTNDPREGWNGREFNNGKQSPQGVYIFKSTYFSPRGDNLMQEGHITLVR